MKAVLGFLLLQVTIQALFHYLVYADILAFKPSGRTAHLEKGNGFETLPAPPCVWFGCSRVLSV